MKEERYKCDMCDLPGAGLGIYHKDREKIYWTRKYKSDCESHICDNCYDTLKKLYNKTLLSRIKWAFKNKLIEVEERK